MKFKLLLILTLFSFHSFGGLEPIYPTIDEVVELLGDGENQYVGDKGLEKFIKDYFQGSTDAAYKFSSEKMGIELTELMDWDLFLTERFYGKFMGKSIPEATVKKSYLHSWLKTYKNLRRTGLKRSQTEYERLRSILEVSNGEIDYAKWSDQTGLHDAAAGYLFRLGYSVPYSKLDLFFVRSRLFLSVSPSEAENLRWEGFKRRDLFLPGRASGGKKNKLSINQDIINTEEYLAAEKDLEEANKEFEEKKQVFENKITKMEQDILQMDREQSPPGGRRERKQAQRQLMRKILEISDGEIDYDKWFGRSTGLNDAANVFMERSGYEKPFNKLDLFIVRFRLNHEAVSASESKRLGWKYSKLVLNKAFNSRNLIHTLKKAGVDIQTAIKKGMRK